MPPKRSTAAVTAASASCPSVTSSLTTRRSLDSPSAAATVSGLRPVATTAWPAASAALAKSAPMPRPAPVINQTCLLIESPSCLLSESLDAVRDLGSAAALVGQLRDREGERLEVPGGAKRPGVDRLKSDVANQLRRDGLCFLVIAAVEQAWLRSPPP